ncbi:MarR family winged helix-turn-helix transcriptional regulator [Rhodococcus sp. B50]|uniref:MarR family winged helix-turn-helix transcriptional regulator n=1 Tax=Rhodococcus sp. B50 TaxID=2682847 RepID=UPI001BD4EB99|nr:MarR family transcriptional regulator [Rhodococcus sp. B50]MBS9374991.1 HTH-type transcriptional repressor NicR [Rhodococcus sp. B50]
MSATHDAAGPDRLGHLPSYLMTQAARHVHRVVFDRLDSADARGHHYRILAALEEYGPSSQVDLARRCGLDRSDVAATVDALVDRRFVERAPDPADRRRNIITLPRRGRRRLFDLDRMLTEAQDEAFAPLDADERALLTSMLTRLVEYHTRPTSIPAQQQS